MNQVRLRPFLPDQAGLAYSSSPLSANSRPSSGRTAPDCPRLALSSQLSPSASTARKVANQRAGCLIGKCGPSRTGFGSRREGQGVLLAWGWLPTGLFSSSSRSCLVEQLLLVNAGEWKLARLQAVAH